MIKALTHSNGIWYTKKGFYGTSYIHTMKKIIFLLICCCVSFNVNAQWYKKYLSGDESKRIPSEWSFIYDAGDKSIVLSESGMLMIVLNERQFFLTKNDGAVPVSVEMLKNGALIKNGNFAFAILTDKHACGSEGFKEYLDSIRNGAIIRIAAPIYNDFDFDVTTTKMCERVIQHQFSSTEEKAKVVCDTVPRKPPKRMVERPRLLSRVGELGFKYNDLFGRIDCWEDRHKDIAPDLPPLKGMKYRTFTTRLPKARNFSRDILAVKSPKKDTLLSWAANMIAKRYGVTIPSDKKFKSSGEIADFVMDNKIASYRRIENELTVEDWGPNEQEGALVADVWHSGDLYTFFYSSWIDSGFHLSMTESWFTINAATGKEYTLFDFIDKRDEAALVGLIAKYLWNHHDRWVDLYPDRFQEHPEWLLDCSGAALTKNGLIVYYHAPQIGCYADGQFNAVIPYEELKSLPHGLLMDIQ